MTDVAAELARPRDARANERDITLVGQALGGREVKAMQPEMLNRMVQLEHTRRLHEFDLAAALRSGEGVEDGVRAPRPGRVARLLAMRRHGHHSSIGTDVAHVS